MSYGGQMQYPGPAGMGAPPVRAPQPPPTQTSIQFMLDENCQLIQSIIDHHQQGIFLEEIQKFFCLIDFWVYPLLVAFSEESLGILTVPQYCALEV